MLQGRVLAEVTTKSGFSIVTRGSHSFDVETVLRGKRQKVILNLTGVSAEKTALIQAV